MTKRRKMTPARKLRIFRNHDGKCAACGRKIMAGETWHVDHITPLALGGSEDDENLQVLHVECHKSKSCNEDIPRIRKADRQAKKHLGLKKRKGRPLPGSKDSGWKRKLDGTWVRRD